jgi:hypothetical protein
MAIRRKGWFVWGVVLLASSGFPWFLFADTYSTIGGDVQGALLFVLILAAALTGLGIFCVRRSSKPRAAVEKVSELVEAARFAKRKERRKKLWQGTEMGFIIFAIMFWVFWGTEMEDEEMLVGTPMGYLIPAAICTGLAIYCHWRRRRLVAELETGSIKALEKAGAKLGLSGEAAFTLPDRKVTVDEFTITKTSYDQYGGVYSFNYPHTRIRVEHRGRIPCVIQVKAKHRELVRFFDRDVYMEWRREYGGQPSESIPQKVKIYGRKVSTALPKESVLSAMEWAKRILDDPNIAALGGSIRIESDQILWVRREGTLPREFLEQTVKVLVSIAEKIEKQY